jgi:hypothetical protein
MPRVQTMIPCVRPGGGTASLPVLGQRAHALIEGGWRVEAWDDGDLYAIRLLHPTDDAVGYGARGETWAAAWEELELTIARLGNKPPPPRR